MVGGHKNIVEEHRISALVAHRPDAVDGESGVVEGDEEQCDSVVLGCIGISTSADPIPLGEVRRGRPRLLAVEEPALDAVLFALGGLQLHRRRVGASVGLGVADGELDVVLEDHRQELVFEKRRSVGDQRLADDADALADLRPTATGQRLVEQVLIDAFAFGAAVLLRPREAKPALVAELLHKRPTLRGIDDLGHVLPSDVEDVGIVMSVEERLDLITERQLFGCELEIHSSP